MTNCRNSDNDAAAGSLNPSLNRRTARPQIPTDWRQTPPWQQPPTTPQRPGIELLERVRDRLQRL